MQGGAQDIDTASLSIRGLRERFSVAGFAAEAAPGGLTPAAVLCPIVLHDDAWTMLLTKRTAHLNDHPGQISFPGGRVEAADASPQATALREAEEEIGLTAAGVEVLGLLPPYVTGTGFHVTPVVGLLTPPLVLQPDAFEVAEAFEVPLSFLFDPANRQRVAYERNGVTRHYYAMPYGDYYIWGATAGMIVSLQRFIAGEEPAAGL